MRLRVFLVTGLLLVAVLLSAGPVTLKYGDWITVEADSRDEAFVDQALRRFMGMQAGFHKQLGFYRKIPMHIRIAPDEGIYRDWGRNRVNPIIEFSEAFVDLGTGEVFVQSPRAHHNHARIPQILLHEYIHLFVQERFRNAPLWFHEGMAVYFSEGVTYDRLISFAWDNMVSDPPTLMEMAEHYPRHQIPAASFYTKSALAVEFMTAKHAADFYRLVEGKRGGRDFSQAFIESFRYSETGFAWLFEDYLRLKLRTQIFFSSGAFLWGLMPFLMIFAWLRKRSKAKRIEEGWSEPRIEYIVTDEEKEEPTEHPE